MQSRTFENGSHTLGITVSKGTFELNDFLVFLLKLSAAVLRTLGTEAQMYSIAELDVEVDLDLMLEE